MRQNLSFFRKQNIYFPCVKSSAGTTVSLATTLSFGPQTQRYIGAQNTRSKDRRCSTGLEGHCCSGLFIQRGKQNPIYRRKTDLKKELFWSEVFENIKYFDAPAGILRKISILPQRKITSDLKKRAATMVSLKDRRATPVLGSRLLRSYVPLRCGPSESGSARDTIVAAYVLHVPYYFYLRKKE